MAESESTPVAFRRIIFKSGLLVCALGAAAHGQVISGRIVSEAGPGVSHVRISAFPLADSSEAATRVAITNENGNFRLRLPAASKYVVRVRRIGFVGEADQIVDLTSVESLTLDVTLRAVAIDLAPVRVTASGGEPKCVSLDDSTQNVQVREWVDHALDAIRARRVIERDFRYQIKVSLTHSPNQNNDVSLLYSRDPDRPARGWDEDDPANLASIARALTRFDVDVLPTEVSVITPIFRGEYCFFNAMVPTENGYSVRFRSKENQSQDLSTAGTISFGSDGPSLERFDFEFQVGKDVVASAHLGFSSVAIEGENYPVVVSRSTSRAATKRSPRARRVDEVVTYSPFTRARGSSPLRPLRLPPGS